MKIIHPVHIYEYRMKKKSKENENYYPVYVYVNRMKKNQTKNAILYD